eukprot:354921-Chlamydomonas_euryale.AAC.9
MLQLCACFRRRCTRGSADPAGRCASAAATCRIPAVRQDVRSAASRRVAADSCARLLKAGGRAHGRLLCESAATSGVEKYLITINGECCCA